MTWVTYLVYMESMNTISEAWKVYFSRVNVYFKAREIVASLAFHFPLPHSALTHRTITVQHICMEVAVS